MDDRPFIRAPVGIWSEREPWSETRAPLIPAALARALRMIAVMIAGAGFALLALVGLMIGGR